MRRPSALRASLCIASLALALGSCASVPAKRVDTLLSGAVAKDLGARLGQVSIAAGPLDGEVEPVLRELFPVAAARVGLAPAEEEGRAEYALWLSEREYEVGLDTYQAVLCSLKLVDKRDGAPLATTIVAEETKLSLKSSGYLYTLLREALASLASSVAASGKTARVAAR
jgi:hypothetical protein